MGVFDRFRGGDDPDSEDGPDAYRVVRKTEKGGWKPVDDFDDMDEPIERDTFEYNASPLKPGEYRLFAVKDNLQTQPPEGVGWILEVDGDRDRDDGQDDEIAELKREIRAMRSETADAEQGAEDLDPSEAVERQKASIQLAALNSEQFMSRHGEKIALAMFGDGSGGGGGSSMEFDDWQDNPVGASLFETLKMAREEPEQIERLGEAIGRGAGSFMGAAADGFAEGEPTFAEAQDAAPEQEPDDKPDEPGRDIDAGPSTMDDLGSGGDGPVDTDALADNIAEARTARKAGPGEQDRPDPDERTEPRDTPAAAESDRGGERDEHPTDTLTDDEAPDAGRDDTATDTGDTMTEPDTTTEATDPDNTAAEIAGDL